VPYDVNPTKQSVPNRALSDIAIAANLSPVQPIMNYPVTILHGKKRSFNSQWFKKYQWLEYSKEQDAAFCFPCRFLVGMLVLIHLQKLVTAIGNMLQEKMECCLNTTIAAVTS